MSPWVQDREMELFVLDLESNDLNLSKLIITELMKFTEKLNRMSFTVTCCTVQ